MGNILRSQLWLFALVCIVSATTAFAQGAVTKSSLGGVVQDSSGSVVPGATVVITNVATGVKNETVSNTAGEFVVPALDPGTYEATISLEGFKTVKIDKIVLVAGTTSSVTAKLEVGTTAETVTVTAHTELVDTTSTTVASTISSQQIQNLPLVTKNAMYMVTFLPGVNSSGTHAQRSSTAMGLPGSAVAITIDGVNVQDQDAKSTDGFYANVRPQTDMVQEVTVSEATATADSSGQGSLQIKYVTRSGSNTPEGSAYEYLRDTRLNTNSWQNEFNHLPKNQINWNQFGVRQGGPIVIPGLIDGHNRAFYFFNYEEFRLAVTSATTRTVLTPTAQSGLFQYNCTAKGCANSVNLLQLAARNGQISAIDPTMSTIFSMINQETGTTGTAKANVDANTYSYSWQPPEFRLERFPFGRVDVNLSDKHRVSGTFLIHKINSIPDIVNSGYSSFPGAPISSNQYSYRQISTATLRSTLTKDLVNEAGFGQVWAPVWFSGGVTLDQYVGGRNFAFLPVGGATPSSYNVVSNVSSRNGLNYNVHDTLNWLKGRHSISMGGNFTHTWDWSATDTPAPPATLGLDTTNDPAAGLFTAANFPGASSTDLQSARNLYATLTGRITAITANATLQPDGSYLYLGNTFRRFAQNEGGAFIQDQWRLTPTFTVNAGVRYELQYPIHALESVYASNNVDDVCGRAGEGSPASDASLATVNCPVGVPGTPLNSPPSTYKQYQAGTPGYKTDLNDFGPSIGVAWQPNVEHGFLHALLGDPTLATLRASYGRSYNAGGLSDYTGVLTHGPGLTANADRNTGLNNLVLPGDAATYGGNGFPVLLSQTGRLGPPPTCSGGNTTGCILAGINYPQSIVFTNGVDTFDPNYQTSYTDSWSVGFQRALGKDMSVEVRYIGNRTTGLPMNIDYNEQDIYNAPFGSSSSFVDEFKKAQKNLAANVAAGRGATFAYTGAPGTSPLPIFLASYTGKAAGAAGNPAAYTGAQWSNPAILPSLSYITPNIFTFASTNTTNGLWGNPTFRSNGIAAGLPANFWVLNPDAQVDLVRTADGFTKYHTIQFLVNRRLSHGLSVEGNYAYQESFVSSYDTMFRPMATLRNASSPSSALPGVPPPHAFKGLVNYELPVGHDKRFGSNLHGWLAGVVADWQVSFTGRVETGRLFDIGDVKLVNMSLSDLQHEFKYYLNPADGFVYDLPQDLIANTIKAFSSDVTSPTGHPICNPNGSNAATCGGPDPTKPYIAPAGDANCTPIITGDCGTRQQLLKAPLFSRFDLSFKKRFPFASRASFDFQVDLLNIFGAIDYNAVFPTTANLVNGQSYRVTTAYSDLNNSYDPGGHLSQLVFRLNW